MVFSVAGIQRTVYLIAAKQYRSSMNLFIYMEVDNGPYARSRCPCYPPELADFSLVWSNSSCSKQLGTGRRPVPSLSRMQLSGRRRCRRGVCRRRRSRPFWVATTSGGGNRRRHRRNSNGGATCAAACVLPESPTGRWFACEY